MTSYSLNSHIQLTGNHIVTIYVTKSVNLEPRIGCMQMLGKFTQNACFLTIACIYKAKCYVPTCTPANPPPLNSP